MASSTTEASPLRDWPKKGPGSIHAGIEMVRYALSDDSQGEPRQRFFSGALQHEPDANLVKAHAPTSTIKEMDSYVYHERREDKDGPNKALPVDKDNHGMDALRYLDSYIFKNSFSAAEAPPDPRLADPMFIRPNLEEEERQMMESAGFANNKRRFRHPGVQR